jgi:hypothetical protein
MSKLVTFGDGNLGIRSAAKRLCTQASRSSFFSNPPEHWDLKRIDSVFPNFIKENREFFMNNKRGLGLWIWQPALMISVLQQTPEDEIVCFLDAGCQLSPSMGALPRLKEYFELVGKSDFLFVQIREKSFGIEDLSETSWTKSECFDYFSLTEEDLRSPQVQSGIILVKNSELVRDFALRWYENCKKNDYLLIKEQSSISKESSSFVSHRYSQSVLSLMVKEEKLQTIPDETYFYPNWIDGLDYPIWSMRNRSGGDAFRRNLRDLIMIGAARIERNIRALF